MTEIKDAYKEAQVQKRLKAIDLIKANPEGWTEEEREIYKDKTMIDFLMVNRMCLIKRIDFNQVTEGGIIVGGISEDSRPFIIGMVASIAPDCRFGIGENGNPLPAAEIKAGDIVMYAVYNGDEIDILGNSFFRVRDMDIHAKLPEAKVAELCRDRSDVMWTIRDQMTYNEKNPNNIGPKSKLHVDNYENKLENKKDKLN